MNVTTYAPVHRLETVCTDPADGVYRSVVAPRQGELAPRMEVVPPIALDTFFGR